MVIDVHTHVFSPNVIANRSVYTELDDWFGKLYASPKAKLASPADLLASMAEDGVEHAVLCGFPWRDPGLCAAENDFLRESAVLSRGKLIAFASVPPAQRTEAGREAARCLAAGMRGIGELNACAQHFSFGDPAQLRPLMEVAQSFDAPVLIHSTEPVGHRYPGKGRASLQGLCLLAQAFPQAKIVLAHWGGGLIFYELMPEVQRALANVYYDTAASVYLYRPTIFAVAAAMMKTDKVLFGSDYPVLGQRRMLEQVRGQDLPQPVLDRILCGNAAALLGLNGGREGEEAYGE
ncbi:MAG: amidohydrolase family protein [Actinobacteria bacterium]|nr:amidohydrolase family protein [Actinomycetota bacterium]